MKMPDINGILSEALENKIQLKADESGEFRILMISDVHGGKGYNSISTVSSLEKLIEKTKPDFVMLAGDTCGPGGIHVENESDLRGVLDTLSSPMEKRKIPWANVFGNHDNNFGYPNDEQEMVYETYPHCMSKSSEYTDGASDFVIPVYSHDGGKILYNIFGLDSHRGVEHYLEAKGYDREQRIPSMSAHRESYDSVHSEQVVWYYLASMAMENYNRAKIPAVMFMHIPLPEYNVIASNRDDTDFCGHQGEDVACSPLNPGMFAACIDRGDVKGIFCGHDHKNDFTGQICGITLGYDGFMSYHASHDEEIRGGRLIVMKNGVITSEMVRVKSL